MSTDADPPSVLQDKSPADEAKLMDRLEDEGSGEEVLRVNFAVPRSKHVKLKILAARRGQSIKEFLTDYIDSFPDQ